ncbi:MAG: membrane protein insertion efficiency factor YidD [Planctomycetota bacterium]
MSWGYRRRERFKLDLTHVPWWRRLLLLPLLIPIRLYQLTLSPFIPPICRFSPTCSDYALEAIQERGVCRGTVLAAWRLLRCNPFSRGGFDPVPPDPKVTPPAPAAHPGEGTAPP